jgi:hypothetical protein
MASGPGKRKTDRDRPEPGRRHVHHGLISRVMGPLGVLGVLGWVLIAIGLVLLSVGYFRVSGNPDPSFQLRVMSAQTAAGLFCTVAGGILVVSRHYQTFAREYRDYRAGWQGRRGESQ